MFKKKNYMYTVSYYDTVGHKVVPLQPVFYDEILANKFASDCNFLEQIHSGNRVYFVERENI